MPDKTNWLMALNVYEGDRPVCQCHTAEDRKLLKQLRRVAGYVLAAPFFGIILCRILVSLILFIGGGEQWPASCIISVITTLYLLTLHLISYV